jgi:hypothetical protein
MSDLRELLRAAPKDTRLEPYKVKLRAEEARELAARALIQLHRADYDALYEQAKTHVGLVPEAL